MATISVITGLPFSTLYIEDVKNIRCDETGVAIYEGELSDPIVKHWDGLGYICEAVKSKDLNSLLYK